jgi:hypothetical protein
LFNGGSGHDQRGIPVSALEATQIKWHAPGGWFATVDTAQFRDQRRRAAWFSDQLISNTKRSYAWAAFDGSVEAGSIRATDEKQVLVLFVATSGSIDDIPWAKLKRFRGRLPAPNLLRRARAGF